MIEIAEMSKKSGRNFTAFSNNPLYEVAKYLELKRKNNVLKLIAGTVILRGKC
jgi:hypothetical protein